MAALPPRLAALEREVTGCRRCPRLVEWREHVARDTRRFSGEDYWGRPVAGFGDPAARILVLGLAPAAHGANRTGRVFTGDRSGDFLFAGLIGRAWRTSHTRSTPRTACDSRRLGDRGGALCAPGRTSRRRPSATPACPGPWPSWPLPEVRVALVSRGAAWDAALRLRAAAGQTVLRPRPRFGHGALVEPPDGPMLLAAFTPASRTRLRAG